MRVPFLLRFFQWALLPAFFRLSLGGSGGGGATASGSNTFSPPLWTLNQWPDFVQSASTIATQPQQHWYGQRIAGINDSQAQGMQYLSDLSGNTSPDMAAARRNMQITASGGFEDPYASAQTLVPTNQWIGQQGQTMANPFVGARNPYGGMSDQYQAMKQASMDDVTRNYLNAVKPGTDAAFNTAGAFHSGAYDAAQSANKYNLAKNLANMSAQMDVGQWDRSGDLAQSDLGRNTSAEQNWLNYINQSSQTDLARNSGLAQQGINTGVQAQDTDLARASQAWNEERNRQMQSFNPILQANQFDQSNARNMIGIGDIQRGYTQDLLNSGLQDWQNQVNYPTQMLNLFGGALSQASGNYGTNTSISQLPMYNANPFATAVGAGLLGAGAYNAWNSGGG